MSWLVSWFNFVHCPSHHGEFFAAALLWYCTVMSLQHITSGK